MPRDSSKHMRGCNRGRLKEEKKVCQLLGHQGNRNKSLSAEVKDLMRGWW